MADIGTKFIVEANLEVKVLTLKARIQERVSRTARIKQDIEDLKKMAIVSKQAELKMLQLELNKLNTELVAISPEDAQIIDV